MSGYFSSTRLTNFIVSIVVVLITGCAFMDLEMHTQKLNNDYGALKPRQDCSGNLTYYTGIPDKPFTPLANVAVNLSTTQIGGKAAWSPDRMIAHLAKVACEKGADALAYVKVEMRNVGLSTSTAPFVSATAVRFKDTESETKNIAEAKTVNIEPPSYQEVPYRKIIQPAFAKDYIGKSMKFEAAFLAIMNTTIDLPEEYKNYVRLHLCSKVGTAKLGTVDAPTCEDGYIQVVINKEGSGPIFDLKQGQNIRILAQGAQTQRGIILLVVDRFELME